MATVSSVLNQKILFGHSFLQRKPDFRRVNIISIRKNDTLKVPLKKFRLNFA